MQAQRNTLFQGETLRGLLLNAWGWSQVARAAFWAGIGLAIAAAAVLGALLYEVFVASPAPASAPVRRRPRWRALV